MTPSDGRLSAVESSRFTCNAVAADAVSAASVRERFGRWLRRHTEVTETKLCDVLLAVNEALANSVEFAYLAERSAGTFDMEAVYDVARAVLTVNIEDQGVWRDRDPLHMDRCRGRGITLMRSLADAVVIDTSARGTIVCLRFENVHTPVVEPVLS